MRRGQIQVVLAGVLAVALFLSSPALASDAPKSNPLYRPAPAVLSDLKAIRAWAENSSWGGSKVETFKFNGTEVIIVRRSFTSGVETCGLTVFTSTKPGWVPGLSMDVWGFSLTLSQDGDSIRVANSSSKAEVARFSISQLQKGAG